MTKSDGKKAANDKGCVISFDLSWAGQTGWASVRQPLVFSDKGMIVKTGIIKPAINTRGINKDLAMSRRASALVEGIMQVVLSEIAIAENCLGQDANLVVAYENCLTWLLAAAVNKKNIRRPVTRDSLVGSVLPVACFWTALGIIDRPEIIIIPVDTQAARRKFGVEYYIGMGARARNMVTSVEKMKGYEDHVKACVGAAVALRLENDRMGAADDLIPETDHEADALLFALTVYDEQKLLWMTSK